MPDAAPHPPDEALDQWLVLRAQAGEEDPLRLLVERWNVRLRRHALRLTDDPEGAAEVMQEAWLAIVRGLRRLEDPACFRRWAYKIVSRRSADWVRSRQANRSRTEPLIEDPVATQHETTKDDLQSRLRESMRSLPQQDRVILGMRYVDAIPILEIAEVLGIPAGTVKSRLHYARARLKNALEPILVKERSP